MKCSCPSVLFGHYSLGTLTLYPLESFSSHEAHPLLIDQRCAFSRGNHFGLITGAAASKRKGLTDRRNFGRNEYCFSRERGLSLDRTREFATSKFDEGTCNKSQTLGNSKIKFKISFILFCRHDSASDYRICVYVCAQMRVEKETTPCSAERRSTAT